MSRFKFYKRLTIDDSLGYGGMIYVYEVMLNDGKIKYIAIPLITEDSIIHDINGTINDNNIICKILEDFVTNKNDELSDDPELALYKLFGNLYKQRAAIKSGEVKIDSRLIVSI